MAGFNGTPSKSTNLSIINADRRTLPGPRLLHELISRTTDDHNRLILDFIASDGERVKLSYEQFHRLTDLLARDILDKLPPSNGTETVVPAIIPQCPELYLAWTSVLKAGAGYCPVSLDVPPERLKFIVKDVEAPCVLTLSTNLTAVQESLGDMKCLSISLQSLARRLKSDQREHVENDLLPQVNPDGPAYVMYTSGSTGLPKGVKVSHLSVTQSLLAHDEHIPVFKRFLQFASPTFDVSIFEIFFPFYRGATLVGCDREHMLSDLPGTIRQLDADAAELTPTVAGTLLRTREAAPCLKTLLTIGEMLTRHVVSEFGGSAEKPSMLYAMYGPTEAAIHCTLAAPMSTDASIRSIGRPFSTVTAYILRETNTLEVAPIGESGELAISGQLADGYLNRPDQNSAAFTNFPGYGEIYKTGDRAVCQPNGELEILGRMSAGQVKIRGQRVELGEIEEVASKARGVNLAVASVIDEVLVLFCGTDGVITSSEVLVTCKSWLPSYMQPGEIVILPDGIPRLPSGKIDRKGLEQNFRESRSSIQETENFEDDVERDVGQVLQSELQCSVYRHASLWSLGMDSLRAIKVASILRERYAHVSATMIAESDNVAELAATIKNYKSPTYQGHSESQADSFSHWEAVKTALTTDPELANLQYEKILPCSPMQIAMLVETTTQPELNFNEISVELRSNVTFDDFRNALRSLARQNEILRSGFVPTSDQSVSFARVVWHDLTETELSLQHPLQVTRHTPLDEKKLLVKIHHALYDGWSWDLILDDLNSILSGRPIPERIQYSDYYDTQVEHTSARQATSVLYWQEALQGFVPTAFPSLCSKRLTRNQKASNTSQFSISLEKLSETSRLLRCSRETILESAWTLLLSAYTDNSDVAIGIVSAGRHLPMLGIETIIGPCLATLPLRIDLSTLRTIHDVIDQVQRQHLNFLTHGSVSLIDIHRVAAVPPGQRLFDTLCVWQEDTLDAGRDRSKICTVDSQDALDYAIVLEFEPQGTRLGMQMTFDADLIPPTHATLLSAQLDHLVEQITTNVDQALDALWEHSTGDLTSLSNTNYESFNDDFHLASTIYDLSQSDPDRIAVEFVQDYQPDEGSIKTSRLSYRDLYMQASKVAAVLSGTYSVRQNELVCVFASKSLDLYIGILGVILAGAAYLCVDVRTPTERTNQILRESRSTTILTDGKHDPDFRPNVRQNLVLIQDMLTKNHTSWMQPPLVRPSGALAYAVFTSGSTGTPKGVLITRRNLLSNLRDLTRIYPSVPGEDRLLQACSPAFDVSVFEIFWTWHRGMTLCAASNDVLFRDIEALIHTLKVTHLSLTPSVAALIDPINVPLVKMLVTAGEPMNSKVFSDWSKGGLLYQGYGPSETTNICNVRPTVTESDLRNNVGPALANTSLFLCRKQKVELCTSALDHEQPAQSFRIVPKGAVGEVWVGGEQVGRGYIDPHLTAKSFMDHPQFGRLYRSGDIGRLLADDSLVIIGREDDQVKLRGQRLELGEINSAMLRSDSVRDAVSMIIKDRIGVDRLVSCWSPVLPHSPTQAMVLEQTTTLFDQLKNVLPIYMIPDTLLYFEDMPLTRQGKVDRRSMVEAYNKLDALQLQRISRENKSSANETPLSELEKAIAHAVSENLKIPLQDIHRNSSFFGLGLDSINAIHLARNLKRRRLLDVDVSTILRNSSIGQLVAMDTSHRPRRAESHACQRLDERFPDPWKASIKEQYSRNGFEVEAFLPCTPLQESMLAMSSNSPSGAYQNTIEFSVYGDLDKLKAAWEQATTRHQLLRTGFVTSESPEYPYVQVILQTLPLPWFDSHQQRPETTGLEPLLLPPWSITIVEDTDQTRLILEIHHALYDAEAMTLLQVEIQAAYHSQELPFPVPFERYISFMDSVSSEEQDRFWQDQLRHGSHFRLGDLVQSQDRSMGGEVCTAELKTTIRAERIQKASKKLSTTNLALFQCAWSRLLFCIFHCEDVCFGTVLSGRNLPIDGVERMVGPCFNTVPTRARVKYNQSISELCHRLQQTNIDVLPYQSSSLRRIQRQIVEDGRPLFDTLLLLQQGHAVLDQTIWAVKSESGNMEFPFILEIAMDASDESDIQSLILKLHSDVAQAQTLNKLLEAYATLLEHTLAFPQARAVDNSVVTAKLPLLRSRSPSGQDARRPNSKSLENDSTKLSEVEEQLVQVIRRLKPGITSPVAKNTTIFRLGLDSIHAVQVANNLRKLGHSISSGDILEAATIERIAALCSADNQSRSDTHQSFNLQQYDKTHREGICSEHSIDVDKIKSVRPCTPTQSGIISQFIRSNGSLYFNTIRLLLACDIDITRLRESWAVAMSVHDMLRTGFVESDDPIHPFTMITYRAGAHNLPWSRFASSPSSKDFSASLFTTDLTTPPWQLTLVEQEERTVLEISMLHALYDARSFEILLRDVASIYLDTPRSVPANVDEAVSRIIGKSMMESSKSFWAETAATDFCSTLFPDLRVYNEGSKTLGVVNELFCLSQAVLEAKCAEANTTQQALFVSAWAAILSAYTGQDHVAFGIILSGRDFGTDRENDVCFPCINTIPFGLQSSQDLRGMLEQATIRCSQVTKHQHTPLTSIKRWLHVEDEIFDTVIALQRYESDDGTQRPWTVVEDEASAEYALSLEIFPEQASKLRFQLTYRQDRVPPQQASYILSQFSSMTQSILSAATKVEPPLNPELLSIVKAKDSRIPSTVNCLHELVENTAGKIPNRPAFEFVTDLQDSTPSLQSWSYAQLDSAGNQIAHLLVEQGVRRDDLVTICFDKCPEASFSILGVLKAGCGYLAVDPSAPEARKSFILEDSGSKIVLTTSSVAQAFPQNQDISIITVDDGRWRSFCKSKPKLSEEIQPQDTCYCLYTSGTTGTPKGCLISHDSAVQAMLSFQRIFKGRWNPDSRWLQFAAFHFDVSVLEQYWSWSVGICVTSVPRDILFEDLPGTINALKITHLDLTPSLARLLTPEEVPSLCQGVFIVGGEQVRQDILDTWGDTQCLYNFYGPSEVTIGCTVHPNVSRLAKPTNIGQQWDNVGSLVLDPTNQKPVFRGAVGELCLSGPLVGKGYLNRPDLTTEKFLMLDEQQTRIYRTGDLVRLLHDDSFDFLGRVDDQVKLRGQRLEIGEINHTILGTTTVIKDVATMVLKHPIQQKDQLVAFFCTGQRRAKNEKPTIVTHHEVETLVAKIKQECMNLLPAYMVPTYYFAVNVIPLTINNKVDNKSLKTVFEECMSMPSKNASDDEYDETGDNAVGLTELIETVATFLQIPTSTIKPSSRLFQLGLDSVSAIGLSRALRKRNRPNAGVATILKYPVVSDLARALAFEKSSSDEDDFSKSQRLVQSFSQKHLPSVTKSVDILEDEIIFIAPCTPLQEGMISKVIGSDEEDTTYFSAFHFALDSDADLEKLKAAWDSVGQSSGILRTYFVTTTDGYAQVVLRDIKENSVQLQRLQNGKTQPTVPWVKYFADWVISTRSFGSQCPWKVDLISLGKRSYMSLQIFHGLYDGISLELLLEKVRATYFQEGPDLKPETRFFEALPYGPLGSPSSEKDFWPSRLSSTARLALSAREINPDATPKVIHLYEKVVDNGLSKLCTKLNVTLPALFQAAWLYVLHQIFGINPTLGVVVSGRTLTVDDAESIIGPLFNTIPFGISRLPKGSTFTDLVRACHQFNIDTVPFQHSPLRQIARYLGQNIHEGLFDVLFVFQKARARSTGKVLWQDISTQHSVPDYPINLEIEQKETCFTATLLVKPEYVDDNQARTLLDAYLELTRDLESVDLPLPHDFCKQAHPSDGFVQPSELSTRTSFETLSDDSQWSELELMVRTEVARLASIPETSIGKDSPTIFEMGLDSIEAMKLAARLRDHAAKVATSAIMKSPTIAGIAGHIETNLELLNQDEQESASTSSIDRLQSSYRHELSKQGVDLTTVHRILPVTSMQEGLLTEPSKYYNVFAYQLREGVDTKRLFNAWEALIRAEPIMRTRFAALDDSEVQDSFIQYVGNELPSVHFTQNRVISELVNNLKVSKARLDIEDHAVHVEVVDNEAGSFVVLGAPHALYDAWSLHLLHHKVARIFRSSTEQSSNDRAIPYERHIQEVTHQGQSSETNRFWNKYMDRVHPTLSASHVSSARLPVKNFQPGEHVNVQLKEALKFCRQQGVTLQSLGLTVWTITLAYLVTRIDVCFGLVLSGRTTENSEDLIFPTFNTVIFAPDIAESDTRGVALNKVHSNMVAVSEHQHFPLRQALRITRASDQISKPFDSLFTFHKLPATECDVPVLYDEYQDVESELDPPYPVNVELEGHEHGLRWNIAIQEGVSGENTVHKLTSILNHVLLSIINDPEAPLLRRNNQGASICGLPAITLATSPITQPNGGTAMSSQSTNASSEANWSPLERTIKNVLAKVSSTDEAHISKTTGFFHLGLDSVSAIKVTGLLKKEGIKLPVSEIIKAQTVEGMAVLATRIGQPSQGGAELLKRSHKATSVPPYLLEDLGLPRSDFEEVFPASSGQVYMLDMWKASGGRLFYPTFWLSVSGTTVDRLQEAMEKLIEDTAMLRTLFIQQNSGETISAIVKSSKLGSHKFPWAFDIEQKNGYQALTLKIHHALYDAVSLGLLFSKLEKLCKGAVRNVGAQANFSGFLMHTWTQEDTRKRFWIDYLTHKSKIYPVLDSGSFTVQRVEKFNPTVLQISELQRTLRRYGISIQALFFATYAQVYAGKWQAYRKAKNAETGTDVIVGIYLANRSLDVDDMMQLAAPTFNIVPLKVRINCSLLEAAQRVQSDLAEITRLENCGVSMREIYAWTGVKVDTYINFLSLPGTASQGEEGTPAASNDSGENVTITHLKVDSEARKRAYRVAEASPFLHEPEPRLGDLEWCLPSIDVEAKVEEGYLGIGVFAPEDMLTERDVEETVECIRQSMSDFA